MPIFKKKQQSLEETKVMQKEWLSKCRVVMPTNQPDQHSWFVEFGVSSQWIKHNHSKQLLTIYGCN